MILKRRKPHSRFSKWLAMTGLMFFALAVISSWDAQAQTTKHAVKNTARLDIDFTAMDLDGKPFGVW